MTSSPAVQRRTLWVTRPAIDLLIGCGGWSAPLLVVAYLLVEPQAERWAVLFYALALVCRRTGTRGRKRPCQYDDQGAQRKTRHRLESSVIHPPFRADKNGEPSGSLR